VDNRQLTEPCRRPKAARRSAAASAPPHSKDVAFCGGKAKADKAKGEKNGSPKAGEDQ